MERRRPNPPESRYGSDEFKRAASALVGNFLSVTGIDVRDTQSVPFLLAPASYASHAIISLTQEVSLGRSAAARRLYAIHRNSALSFESEEMTYISGILIMDLLAIRIDEKRRAGLPTETTDTLLRDARKSFAEYREKHFDENKARVLEILTKLNMRELPATRREKIYACIRNNAWEAAEQEIDAFTNRPY